MAFDFESLRAKARELTNTGMNKAKELTEIGKLKVQNVSEQEEIRKAYLSIGKLYFEQYGENPGEGFEAFCKQVAESKAKIEYNNQRIEDMKAAGNLSDEDLEEEIPSEDTPEL